MPQFHHLMVILHPFALLQAPDIQLQNINFFANEGPHIGYRPPQIPMDKLLDIGPRTGPNLQYCALLGRPMKDHLMDNFVPVHQGSAMEDTYGSFLEHGQVEAAL